MATIIYMDNNATTKPHNFLLKRLQTVSDIYGNPSSLHPEGLKAKEAITDSRQIIADMMGIEPEEIIFTSSATEANNLVLRGCTKCVHRCNRHIITTSIEHASILQTCKDLQSSGKCKVTYLTVDTQGLIKLDELEEKLRSIKEVTLTSIIGANNVTGVIQPVAKIGGLCRKYNSIFHVDMTQLVGKLPIHPKELGIDIMSFSGHKFHCIKGIGGLFVDAEIKGRLHPCITGGGHEFHLRAGTENVPGIIMMALCLRYNIGNPDVALKRYQKIGHMRNVLQEAIIVRIPGCVVNSKDAPRMYNTLSICLPGIDSHELIEYFNSKGVCISIGSACSNLSEHGGDYVLEAMGVPKFLQNGAIRISLSEYNTLSECRKLVNMLEKIVSQKTQK
jgi:cysteine desulfurase